MREGKPSEQGEGGEGLAHAHTGGVLLVLLLQLHATAWGSLTHRWSTASAATAACYCLGQPHTPVEYC